MALALAVLMIWTPHAQAQTDRDWWEQYMVRFGPQAAQELADLLKQIGRQPPRSIREASTMVKGAVAGSGMATAVKVGVQGFGVTGAATAGSATTAGVILGGLSIGWAGVETHEWAWCKVADLVSAGGSVYPLTQTDCEVVDDPVAGNFTIAHEQTHDNEYISTDYDLMIGTRDGTTGSGDHETMRYIITDPDPGDAYTSVNATTFLYCTDEHGWNQLVDTGSASGIANTVQSHTVNSPYGEAITVVFADDAGDQPACPYFRPYAWATATAWGIANGTYDNTHDRDRYALYIALEGEAVADRRIDASAKCVNDATGEQVTVQEFSAQYSASDASRPSIPAVSCPDGWRLVQMSADRIVEDGAGNVTDRERIGEWEAPTSWTDPADPNAACYGLMASADPCVVMLWKVVPDAAGTGTQLVPCTSEGVTCAGWVDNPDREALYDCRWAPLVAGTPAVELPLSDCAYLREFPEVLPEPPTTDEPAPDGSPADAPAEVDDPVTDPNLDPTPDMTPGLDDGCVPSWWEALTPWGMTKAGACVLRWAFVPTPVQLQTVTTNLQTGVMTKVPFAYGQVVEPVITELPALVGAECTGYLWDLTPADSRVGYDSVRETHGAGSLAVPCAPPGWWDPVRGLLVAMVVVGTAWGLWNQVGAAVGGPKDGDSPGDF